MPNKSYRKGYRFEVRVLKKLESLGYKVARQGASRFPDIFAVGSVNVFFGECKNHRKIPNNPVKLLSKEEYRNALEMIQTGKPFLLFYNENHKIKVLAIGGKDAFFAGELEILINGGRTDIGR